jgi:hypothetical protein
MTNREQLEKKISNERIYSLSRIEISDSSLRLDTSIEEWMFPYIKKADDKGRGPSIDLMFEKISEGNKPEAHATIKNLRYYNGLSPRELTFQEYREIGEPSSIKIKTLVTSSISASK